MIVVTDPFDMASSLRVMAKARNVEERLEAIMFGGEPLCNQGISKVYMVRSSSLPRFVTASYAEVVCRILAKVGEGTVLFPATPFCKSLAPRIAAKMECGLTADCIELEMDGGDLLQISPAFSGNALATIVSSGSKFRMVTVVANNPVEEVNAPAPEVVEFEEDLSMPGIVETVADRVCVMNPGADVVLSAGYGIGSSKCFDRMMLLAEKMGASVGATLAAVNAGFAPHEFLVGQTGMAVCPRVYVAFGISGHMQHTVGISSSSMIVSVNTDAESQMSRMADYAIVADASNTIEKLLVRYE